MDHQEELLSAGYTTMPIVHELANVAKPFAQIPGYQHYESMNQTDARKPTSPHILGGWRRLAEIGKTTMVQNLYWWIKPLTRTATSFGWTTRDLQGRSRLLTSIMFKLPSTKHWEPNCLVMARRKVCTEYLFITFHQYCSNLPRSRIKGGFGQADNNNIRSYNTYCK